MRGCTDKGGLGGAISGKSVSRTLSAITSYIRVPRPDSDTYWLYQVTTQFPRRSLQLNALVWLQRCDAGCRRAGRGLRCHARYCITMDCLCTDNHHSDAKCQPRPHPALPRLNVVTCGHVLASMVSCVCMCHAYVFQTCISNLNKYTVYCGVQSI